nr:MAG TPA: hypothetical protein [Caudoviricetes sp.]
MLRKVIINILVGSGSIRILRRHRLYYSLMN